jgi:hypothetical protein
LSPWGRRLFYAFLVGSSLTLGRNLLKQAILTVREPPEYDLGAFWIYGRVAVTGGNYYLPEAMHQEGDRLGSSPVFTREVLDVGFLYPPPTMLLIAPLGLLNHSQAALAWQVVSISSLIAAALLLWRLFLPASGVPGLGAVAALLLSLPATLWNIQLTQTNLVVLFCLAAFWAMRDRPISGFFLALGTAVKPVVALIGLYLLLQRQWKAVAFAAGTYAGLALLALACFGWAPFLTYFVSNPVSRIAGWTVVGHNSVSLLATAFKLSGEVVTAAPLQAPWSNPLFLTLASMVLGTTLWLMYRLPRAAAALGEELSLALLIPAALLLYPNTLHHYTVVLVLPLLWIWTRASRLQIAPLAVAAIIGGTYWLELPQGGDLSVLSIALVWASLGVMGVRMMGRAERPRVLAAGAAPAAGP